MSKANPFHRMSRKGAVVLQLSTFGWCQTILQNQQTRPKSLLLLSADYRKLPMRPRMQEERVQGSGVRTRKHLGHFFMVLFVPSELAQAQSRIYHLHSIRMCMPNFMASWTKQHSSWRAGWGHTVMSPWLSILSLLSRSIRPRNVSSKENSDMQRVVRLCSNILKICNMIHVYVPAKSCQQHPHLSPTLQAPLNLFMWSKQLSQQPGSDIKLFLLAWASLKTNNYSGHLVSGLKWQNQILSPKAKKAN